VADKSSEQGSCLLHSLSYVDGFLFTTWKLAWRLSTSTAAALGRLQPSSLEPVKLIF
jgi:hypothetical protein